MDKIIIKNILVRGIIGIREWERANTQDILINLELFTQRHKSDTPDDITYCIDYSVITKNVINLVEHVERFTLEALAEDIAQLCMEDSRVLKATVRVEKPGAVRFSQSVGVEIERRRNSKG